MEYCTMNCVMRDARCMFDLLRPSILLGIPVDDPVYIAALGLE